MRRGRGRGGRSTPYDPSRSDRASRSGSQGVVEEAATQEEEEPVAGAPAAPGKLPPLGKENLKRRDMKLPPETEKLTGCDEDQRRLSETDWMAPKKRGGSPRGAPLFHIHA